MQIYNKKGDYTKTFLRYMRNAYDQYLKSNCNSIFKAYEKPSIAKINAWYGCRNRADSDVIILSYNVHSFTAAYIMLLYGEEEFFVVETAYSTYRIPIQYVQ